MQPRSTSELLYRLTERTHQNLEVGRELLALGNATLYLRPRPQAWNALECMAHLNHYGDFYLPEIRRRIQATKYPTPNATFTSSRLGNYFAAGMKPSDKMKKISTFKNADPVNYPGELDKSVITEFIRQQEEMLELLKMAAGVDLTRTKTGISITNLIKLRLGDTLRVVVYHNWRHVEQALAAVGKEVAA